MFLSRNVNIIVPKFQFNPQLLEDRRNSGGEMSDADVANMEVDPEEQETKE